MTLYNVVFSGQLLEGFEPEQVKAQASARMRLSAAHLDRLFNGKPAVVKKSVDDATGKRFVRQLSQIGMDTRLVQILQVPAAKAADAQARNATLDGLYKVVFFGSTLPGFDTAVVKGAAAKRLGQPVVLMDKVFSGHKVVLKRNIAHAQARRYVEDLASIGMRALLEEQTDPNKLAAIAPPPVPSAPPVDFNKTQINPFAAAYLAEQLALPPEEPAPGPGAAEMHPDLSKTLLNPLSDEQLQAMMHNTQFDIAAHQQVYGHEAIAKTDLPPPEAPSADGNAIRHRLNQASASIQAELEAKLMASAPAKSSAPTPLAEPKETAGTAASERNGRPRSFWQRAFRGLFKRG